MQWARFAVWGVIATLGIGGVALAADALVESDEERVAQIAASLSDASPERRIEGLLAWIDPTRVEVTVRANRTTERFGEYGDPGEAIRDALEPLSRGSVDVVQQSITLEGDRAHVALRLRSDGVIVDTGLDLRRDGQAWLVSEVRRID